MTQPSFEEIALAYQALFATTNGQAVLKDLEQRFAYVTQSTVDDTFNPHAAMYREGQRSVLAAIGMMLSFDPNDPQYQEENHEDLSV